MGWSSTHDPRTGAVIGTTGTGTAARIQTKVGQIITCYMHPFQWKIESMAARRILIDDVISSDVTYIYTEFQAQSSPKILVYNIIYIGSVFTVDREICIYMCH